MSVHALVVKPSAFHAQICSLMDMCKYVCVRVRLCMCAHKCAHARVPLCKSVRLHVCVCLCVCVCVNVRVNVCVCARTSLRASVRVSVCLLSKYLNQFVIPMCQQTPVEAPFKSCWLLILP